MRNAGTLEFGNNCVPLAVRCTLRIGEQWESLADAQKFCSGKTCQIMRNAGTLEIIVYLCTAMQIGEQWELLNFSGTLPEKFNGATGRNVHMRSKIPCENRCNSDLKDVKQKNSCHCVTLYDRV